MERCLLEFMSLKAMKDFMSFTNKDLRTLINQERSFYQHSLGMEYFLH